MLSNCFAREMSVIVDLYEGSGWGGGSGIHYSLKNYSIIHLIKGLGYSLKLDQLFITSEKDGKEIRLLTFH